MKKKTDKVISIMKQFILVNKNGVIVVAAVVGVAALLLSYSGIKKYSERKLWRDIVNVYEADFTTDYSYDEHEYENGTYKVGDTISAGEYVLYATSDYGGYFCLSSDMMGDNIICNDNFQYNSIIRIRNGEYLELKRCYAEPIETSGTIPLKTKGAMYKVGTNLDEGDYILEAAGEYGGYYCIYSDDRQDDIYANKNFEGTSYITVRTGQYLQLSRCEIKCKL